VLNSYYGITGNFCPVCRDKVSHDSNRNPNHPDEYLLILLKQSSHPNFSMISINRGEIS
jgi:hypothetical protein